MSTVRIKAAIHLSLRVPVPVRLIGRIAKFRAKEVVDREVAKKAARQSS